MSAAAWIVLGLLAWVLVSAAIACPVGRRLARCAPPDPDDHRSAP